MAKTYKILVNDGKGTDIQPVRVVQGAGANGGPARLLAKRGWRFELQDDLKGKSLAPDQVRIKRMGKNLTLMFDGSQHADVVIEDFYAENTDKDKDNGSPKLVGTAENGGMYEYVPQDPAVSSMPAELKDGNTPVIMALGGGPLEGDFVLAGLPLVAAAGGISGWAVAGGAVAAAAAGGGGGGGSGAAVVVPSKATGLLTHDAVNDTGVSNQDSITKNQNPTYSGVADKGATVEVTVNGVVYTTTASTKDGSYSIPLTNNGKPLGDGVYTPSIKVSNATGGTITSDGAPFTIDHTTDKNQDATKSPTTVVDDNSGVTVAIASIDDASTTTTAGTGSKDTGTSKTDFITSDRTLTFSGTAVGFKANGDLVHVQVLNANGIPMVDQYVMPDSNGKWMFNNQANTMSDGQYTIKATIEDQAGNAVKGPVTQVLQIASAAPFLFAQADTATVTEDSVLNANNVLSNDGDSLATSMSVIKVQKGDALNNTASVVVGNGGTPIQGDFGQLELFADGHYVYTPNGKLKAGEHQKDTFSYEVQANGATPARVASTSLTIDVTGVSNSATVALKNQTSNFDLSTLDDITSRQGIVVTDADRDESVLQGALVSGESSPINGTFGNLTLTGDGTGVYNWIYTKTETGSVTSEVTQHDLFALVSQDGSASQTLDFRVTNATHATEGGDVANTSQEFYLIALPSLITQGLKVKGSVGTTDTLILNSPNTDGATFDLTGATTSLESVEKIQLGGAGTKVLKLSLADLMQLDTSNSVPTKLFIDGDPNTTLVFNNGTVTHPKSGVYTVDEQHVYDVYRFGNDELLVQTTISNVTVTG